METIHSFTIDHDKHGVGFYLSTQNEDIFTYDLRFMTPNGGKYLTTGAMHTVEHLFATVIRNGDKKEDVIYFGPMGCRTGFYLLMRNTAFDEAKAETLKTLEKCLTLQEIPGNKREECGNYLDHDLEGAKEAIRNYIKILQ